MARRPTKAELQEELDHVIAASIEQGRRHAETVSDLEAKIEELETLLFLSSGVIENRIREGLDRLELDGPFDPARAATALHLARVLDSINPAHPEIKVASALAKQLGEVLTELTPQESSGAENPLAKLFQMEDHRAAK